MNSRKAARQALATALGTITTFVAVYDHETLDFGRRSPVGMVHSDGTGLGPGTSLAGGERMHGLIISIWWRRDESSEDYIDDLSQEVYDKLLSLSGPTADWSGLDIDEEFSEMDYLVLDGVMYRRERIRVVIW